jgi:hypothetical protein
MHVCAGGVHVWMYVCDSVHVCTCVYMCVCVCVHVCVCTWVYMCVYVHVRVHVCFVFFQGDHTLSRKKSVRKA